ncbi:hypothetical protein LSA2308_00140 [Staphylococcus phage LSA2308]|nr:hypothetical protein LSA2308_00140 [Staphylococcus phage LSA2308]USZ62871.1 hypothetical protein LSA2311_orf00063 [Staphylococcus phage LSA2311]
MNNNIAVFIFKTLIIIIFILFILSIINSLSLIYSIRPSTVMTYFIFGGIVSNVALTITDKLLLHKEDPLPDYILKEVELNNNELQVLKKIVESQTNVSAEEVRVRAKSQRRILKDKKRDAVNENEEGH